MITQTITQEENIKEKIKNKKEYDFGIKIEEMLEKGVALGHQTAKLHPKMKDYVIGIKNTIHIIDLKKTASCLKKALEFISGLVKQKKTLLIIGTKPPLRNLIKETATKFNFPYITERWLGGTITNFNVISERLKKYRELEEKKRETEFKDLPKKERIRKEKKLEFFKKKFEGIKNLEELPATLFICDLTKDKLALKEARQKNIKIIAIVDTNANPSLVDYPIPANDDAVSSVKYIFEKIEEAIK